ncbi:MAG: winged helix-turn-helix domain-containing protein [Candidatus Woesearchaeota archaeon]
MAEKRPFKEIRETVLKNLASGRKTINQISLETNINWRTVSSHLTYLMGKKLVVEVFHSEYVRIFELSEEGKRYLEFYYPEFVSQLKSAQKKEEKEVPKL